MESDFLEAVSDLSAEELALFLFTADGAGNRFPASHRPLIIPSKDCVVWAMCAHEFVRRQGLFFEENIEEEFNRTVAHGIEIFIRERMDFFRLYKRNMSPYPVPLSRYEELFGIPRSSLSTEKIRTFKNIEVELERRNLIRDPFGLPIPGAEIIILGLIPYGFSLKTDEGSEKTIRINAWLWDFKFSSGDHGREIYFKVNVARTVDLIKRHIAASCKKIDDERR